MAYNQNLGVNNGRVLVQQNAKIGGVRYVFVDLRGGAKNELVTPPLGCVLKNPFKTEGKFFAGDLVEYRTDGTGYILKTYEVAKATSNETILIKRDGFRHVPCVGDILMKAPSSLTTKGAGYTVTNVVAKNTREEGDVWEITVNTALGSLSAKDVLVEAASAGASVNMLVQNPNMMLGWDMDCFYAPSTGDEDFDNARYLFDPILGQVAYENRMSVLPSAVKALNRSRVKGWFEI